MPARKHRHEDQDQDQQRQWPDNVLAAPPEQDEPARPGPEPAPEPPTPDQPGEPQPAVPAPGGPGTGEGAAADLLRQAREADGELAAVQIARPDASVSGARSVLGKLIAALEDKTKGASGT